DAVARQRIGDHAHQLEPDEQVEEVPRQCEPAHRADEDEHQDREELSDFVEVPPREDERGERERRNERCDSRAPGVDDERDPERDAVARFPAAEPVDEVVVVRAEDEQERDHQRRRRRRDRDQVVEPPPAPMPDSRDQGRAEEGDRNRQRDEHVHQPRTGLSSSGFIVFAFFLAWIASASNSAATVTLTTMSVRVSAWTTGSTAFVPNGTSLKIGAPPCLT